MSAPDELWGTSSRFWWLIAFRGNPKQVVLDVDDEAERASADRLGRAIRQHVTMAEEITAAAMVRLALGILSCLT
jgi:fructose-1,6-bisphosphatase/inositol monophosphatase family enzyme